MGSVAGPHPVIKILFRLKRELVRGEKTVTTPVRVIRRTAVTSAALA